MGLPDPHRLSGRRSTLRPWALVLAAACSGEPQTAGPFDFIFRPGDGAFLHVSSYDTTGGNRDRHEIPSGGSVTLLEVDGPAVIRRIWMTVASRDPHHYRRIALRMYWDGEAEPSVAVPLGDFFGNPWDRRHWASQFMGASSGGYFVYLPMPFRRHARIVVENESDHPVDAFYFNADLETGVSLPDGVATLHAAWNRDRRTTAPAPYRVLEARGTGRFVGLLFNAMSHAGNLGFLEGDEIFHVDGEFRGQGTGTEDYFNAGWYFDRGEFAAPHHGLIVKDDSLARIAAYRWHMVDPVPFRDSVRIELEHGHANEEIADYATVAFWYQTEPHAPRPGLPPAVERLASAVRMPAGVVVRDSLSMEVRADSVVLRVAVTRPDRYAVQVWPQGGAGAEPVRAGVAGTAVRRELSRISDVPGALDPVTVDTVSAGGDSVALVITGPDAAAAVSAVRLRPVRNFAREWYVAGPVPSPQRLGSEHSVALEDAAWIDPGSRTTGPGPWVPALAGADGQVRLNALFSPSDWVGAYARSWLYSPVEQEGVLLFGADDAHVLWVNGTEVSRRQGRNISVADDLSAVVRLHAGWNAVLLFVADLDGGWGFHMRAADPSGRLRWSREPGTGNGGGAGR